MKNPFKIEGPAVVSFSGGRTSGLMLRRIMDAGIGPDVHVLFANTGKEREETLQFVHDCETRWNVPIHWLEYALDAENQPICIEKNFETASRKGEPFRALIFKRHFLPNPVARFCTEEMKILTAKRWMMARGYSHWTNAVGLRADEMHRVARMNGANDAGKERWEVLCPLAIAGLTKQHVMSFWGSQDFDLRLQTWEGNCDLCFLKGANRIKRVMRDDPELAAWWIETEEIVSKSGLASTGATFRSDRPSYAKLLKIVQDQPILPGVDDDSDGDALDCFCTN